MKFKTFKIDVELDRHTVYLCAGSIEMLCLDSLTGTLMAFTTIIINACYCIIAVGISLFLRPIVGQSAGVKPFSVHKLSNLAII